MLLARESEDRISSRAGNWSPNLFRALCTWGMADESHHDCFYGRFRSTRDLDFHESPRKRMLASLMPDRIHDTEFMLVTQNYQREQM